MCVFSGTAYLTLLHGPFKMLFPNFKYKKKHFNPHMALFKAQGFIK